MQGRTDRLGRYLANTPDKQAAALIDIKSREQKENYLQRSPITWVSLKP